MFQQEIQIETHIIGDNHPPFIIAEIGLNHNNDLEIGKNTIKAAAKAGAHAVKFQSYITEEFIDKDNHEADFLFQIFKQYELSEQKHIEFQKTAKDEGIIFFSTPLCVTSLQMLLHLQVPVIKIASGDIINSELLVQAARTQLPLIVSTGASSLSEITRCIQLLEEEKATNLCLMHCVSLYPTPLEKLNLSSIPFFKKLINAPIGFSDHSAGCDGALAAVAMGARVIEKHFTLDKSLPGPDHIISANPEEMKLLVEKTKQSYFMIGEPRLTPLPEEKNGHFFGRRSLYNHASGKILSLRPDMSLKDTKIAGAWDYLKLKNPISSKSQINTPYLFGSEL